MGNTNLNRSRSRIIRHLEDFPRQYAALEKSMLAFGEDFDLRSFKEAFNTYEDFEAYNKVQTVERALSRVQNYVAQLAIDGVRIGGFDLSLPADGGGLAQQSFETLKVNGVINGELSRKLMRAQRARSAIEHAYFESNAGDVHRATLLIHEAALGFISKYRTWITPYLK